MNPLRIKFVITNTFADEDEFIKVDTCRIINALIGKAESQTQDGQPFLNTLNNEVIPAYTVALMQAVAKDMIIPHITFATIICQVKITGLKPRTAGSNASYKWRFDFIMDSAEYVCVQAFQDNSFLCYNAASETKELMIIKLRIEMKAMMLGFYKE